LDILIRKGASADWKGYAQTQLDYRPFKAGNTYFMLQWFQGYGEDLLNYKTNRSMLRIGMLLKPPYLNLY
jgi:phospholipase A1/A2